MTATVGLAQKTWEIKWLYMILAIIYVLSTKIKKGHPVSVNF